MQRHYIAVNKVIMIEKIEMAFASPLHLFLVSVSQLCCVAILARK